jgi:iron complex transport system permease protein
MVRLAPVDLGRTKSITARLLRALVILSLVLAVTTIGCTCIGTESINFSTVFSDPTMHTLFFGLRLPRVIMAAIIGASLAIVGATLQAMFRNPLADPFILGVSGGGAVGASIAIAFGIDRVLGGIPFLFLSAFLGSLLAVFLVYQIARAGRAILPGALLLAGIAVNLIASSAVITIQFLADPNRAHQIMRWTTGSLDVVGFATIRHMTLFLVPAWIALLMMAEKLHLLAIDEDTAMTLGVNVKRCELLIHLLCSLLVAVTVAVGGAVGFVGLIVPHAVRFLFGEDLRIVLPGSLLLGASFLVAADTVARTALGSTELPVGAVTALLGGPVFLFLLRRRQRYSAL